MPDMDSITKNGVPCLELYTKIGPLTESYLLQRLLINLRFQLQRQRLLYGHLRGLRNEDLLR